MHTSPQQKACEPDLPHSEPLRRVWDSTTVAFLCFCGAAGILLLGACTALAKALAKAWGLA